MDAQKELSQTTIQRLDYYVYLYIDPSDNKIFYVGKGNGNRVFAHLKDHSDSDSKKAIKIRNIRDKKQEPRIEILRHGLDEKTALNIEAAVIDAIGISNLANEISGTGTDQGRMELEMLGAILDPQEVEIQHPAILIRINELYRYGMSADELYEATCGIWTVGERRYKAKYAFAIYSGVVQEVYRIKQWFPAGSNRYKTRPELNEPYSSSRWEFVGEIAEIDIRETYRLKSVKKYLSNNSQNPIKYVNC